MSKLKFLLQAWKELFLRYKDVGAYFWKRRHSNDLPLRTLTEAEFMPAALSLQTRPVSPVGRWSGRIVMLLILGALLLAIFGRVDIIVTGTGKVVPVGQPKLIATTEAAYVTAVFVSEGSQVKAGDPLIQLDPRLVTTEEEKAKGELQIVRLQYERSRALLEAIQTGNPPRWQPLKDVDEKLQAREMHQLQDIWQDYSARRQRMEQEMTKLSRVIPLLKGRADDYAVLLQSGDVAQHSWAEREQARIEAEGQLNDMKAQLTVLNAETRKSAQDSLHDADRSIRAFDKDFERAKVRRKQMLLTAPVDGIVQQLAVNTIGGVAPAAQVLMQLVPNQAALEVQVSIDNKDIGFLQVGQSASLKVTTFDYTRYGTIPAKIIRISPNAIDDEKKGLYYTVALAPERDWVSAVQGKPMALSTGQAISAEIRTGERRVIQYLLSPLVRHVQESMHER
ncbi:MAG: HlyD family type I secretion periplasmic adaptor subunit [Rhodoferax sp.]|nr:HlyD family type I secretion periplasmic adaptor subunit [Rhodoferax sp.]